MLKTGYQLEILKRWICLIVQSRSCHLFLTLMLTEIVFVLKVLYKFIGVWKYYASLIVSGHEVIKLFSMLNSTEHEIYLADKC